MRIEELESRVNAWSHFDKSQILAQASLIDKKVIRGGTVGALCGVPIGIKDIFNTKDMPTGMGSPIWEGFTPGNDARAVEYLRWADGIIAGKTVTAEFALHHAGKTVNPHNYDYSPGTSSSGSAASVASYMVPIALGTQTAGSTIRPASYCGIYGMKPTYGLVPRTGVLKSLDTLDHVSFFSRSVEDLHLMLEVLRVRGPNFPFVHKHLDNRSNLKAVCDYQWKVAFVKGPVWNHADRYAQNAMEEFVSKLAMQPNIQVEEPELPSALNFAHETHELIYSKAISYYFKDEYENHRRNTSASFRNMVENGRKISHDQYLDALNRQELLLDTIDDFLDGYDVAITLSTAGEAPKGLEGKDKKDSCLIWTLCHVPTVNLPIFKSPNGMPFGAQAISKRYSDYDLLDFSNMLFERGFLS